MLFGLSSTKSVLGEEEPVVIDTQVVSNQDALIGEAAK
jgi:hypothetical protein